MKLGVALIVISSLITPAIAEEKEEEKTAQEELFVGEIKIQNGTIKVYRDPTTKSIQCYVRYNDLSDDYPKEMQCVRH